MSSKACKDLSPSDSEQCTYTPCQGRTCLQVKIVFMKKFIVPTAIVGEIPGLIAELIQVWHLFEGSAYLKVAHGKELY